MLIGLTGGIATGKSTVAAMMERLGARVIDADHLARAAIEPDGPAFPAVVREFGSEILDEGGRIDRARLRRIIFRDPRRRILLESLVHPHVLQAMQDEVRRIRESEPLALVVCEVPLLFEAGLQDRFDLVVVVWASPEAQRARLEDRDGAAEVRGEEIRSQLPMEQKVARADRVIRNTGTREDTLEQVKALLEELRSGIVS